MKWRVIIKVEKKLLNLVDKVLPTVLFLKYVLRVHEYLKQRVIETWMWGDMLISPEEFPKMEARALHGSLLGYGKNLRDKLPRDIVICDWHYADKQSGFPSLAQMKSEGFRVLGSTFKKKKTIRNFTRYAAEYSADGMIATTWFHVSRREWGTIDEILRYSGEFFLRYFPDDK